MSEQCDEEPLSPVSLDSPETISPDPVLKGWIVSMKIALTAMEMADMTTEKRNSLAGPYYQSWFPVLSHEWCSNFAFHALHTPPYRRV